MEPSISRGEQLVEASKVSHGSFLMAALFFSVDLLMGCTTLERERERERRRRRREGERRECERERFLDGIAFH